MKMMASFNYDDDYELMMWWLFLELQLNWSFVYFIAKVGGKITTVRGFGIR